MDDLTVLLIAALVLAAVVAFGAYRWLQRRRVLNVNLKIKEYLRHRFGQLPDNLRINCSDDPLWPILVSFTTPPNDDRHNLQFMCSGPISKLALLSE